MLGFQREVNVVYNQHNPNGIIDKMMAELFQVNLLKPEMMQQAFEATDFN